MADDTKAGSEASPAATEGTGSLVATEVKKPDTGALSHVRTYTIVRAGEQVIFVLAIIGATVVGLGITQYFRENRYIGAYLLAYAGFRFADLLVSGTPEHIGSGGTLTERVTRELPLLVLFASAPFERTYIWGGEPARWLGKLGLLFELLGLWLALGSRVQLHFFSSDRAGHERRVLVTNGFFRYLRHPTYAGVLLALLAWPIVFAAWISFLVIAGICAILTHRQIIADERVLLARFGEQFEEYRRTTDALIPSIW